MKIVICKFMQCGAAARYIWSQMSQNGHCVYYTRRAMCTLDTRPISTSDNFMINLPFVFCRKNKTSVVQFCLPGYNMFEGFYKLLKARDQKQIYRLNETVSHWGFNPPPSRMRQLKFWTFWVKFCSMWKMNQNQGSFWRKNDKKFLLSQ